MTQPEKPSESIPDRTPIDRGLLSILCCPETHQRLNVAPADLIAQLNRRITAQQLRQRDQQQVYEPMDGGLLREDEQVLYPIRDGIPMMLINQGIPLAE